jgi:hypothetical protein
MGSFLVACDGSVLGNSNTGANTGANGVTLSSSFASPTVTVSAVVGAPGTGIANIKYWIRRM